MRRVAKSHRVTAETDVSSEVDWDGSGVCHAETGFGFLDHMLTTLAKHSLIDINLKASGDLRHHLIEDTAIVLGEALSKALGDRNGIKRFGYAVVPMDEALALAAVDLVKRPKSVVRLRTSSETIEDVPVTEIKHFFETLATSLQATIQVRVLAGEDDHHKTEACFKALALALRQAAEPDPRRKDSPSAKGTM